ncbi:hypothetical protein HPB52_021549 [Rhipicephalus sanguineus]|uniref:Endonuclease/exonuclease/phosphatase domain-containing protein n=1 Tax=Rhipicephalus sanguineus TaxID=34632 RepID=A0A9D4PF80_RHISA|nr:hypothetical protein HPB52_021549 [Rhipicephalus sanguineus]
MVLGDINVKHPYWGYPKADGPGTRLWQLAHDLRLTLLTDTTQPMRLGNSVCRDTTSGLRDCRYVHDAPTHTNPWPATTMFSPCKYARSHASRVHTLSVMQTGTRFVRVASTRPLPILRTFRDALTSFWRT